MAKSYFPRAKQRDHEAVLLSGLLEENAANELLAVNGFGGKGRKLDQ